MPDKCLCGCEKMVSIGRKFVSGHNLVRLPRSATHRRRIADGQRRAWQTKRQRLPIGTTHTNAEGYVLVKVVAGKGRWMPQHVLVMERHIGRLLTADEVVHHINGDKADNRIENLYLCRNQSHHRQVHNSESAVIRLLMHRGIVTFADGRYETVL